MKRLFSCLIIFYFAALTSTQDCRSSLLTTFGFTALSQPTTVSGLRFCKSLQNGQSCCSADTINSFQTKSQALSDKLVGYAAKRDKEMVQARDVTIPQMKAQFDAFKQAYNQVIAAFDQQGSDPTMTIVKSMLQQLFGTFVQMSQKVYADIANLKGQYASYLKSRSTCAVQLIKLQASAWCLACDPNYASKGVSGTTVAMSDTVCGKLQTACYDYLVKSEAQNGLLYLRSIAPLYQKMSESLASGAAASGGSTGLPATNPYEGLDTSQLLAILPSARPSDCTSATSCKWICSSLFNNGQISEVALSIGGDRYPGTRRLLLEEEDEETGRQLPVKESSRKLQSSAWNPEDDEAGVTVTYSEDPGNTANASNGASFSLMCVVGMLVALIC